MDGTGCAIVATAFASQFIVEGIFMSFTVFYSVLVDYFDTTVSQVSVIGSMAYGGWFLVAPISTKLVEKCGAGLIVLLAGIISSTSLLICSFATALWQLTVLFGVIVGICFGMVYLPAFTISSYYVSQKWQHFAAVFATVGGALGGVAFPQVFVLILEKESWRFAFAITAGIVLHLTICGSVFHLCESAKAQANDLIGQVPCTDMVEEQAGKEAEIYNIELTAGISDEPKALSLQRCTALKGCWLNWTSSYYPRILPFLISNFLWNAGYFSLLTLLPLYMSHLGIADSNISMTFSMGCLAIAAGRVSTAIFAGWKHHYSIAYYNMVTLAAAGTALPFSLIKGSFSSFLALNAFYGFFFGSQVAITPSAVLSYVGLENMDHCVGLLLFATGLGGVTGPIAVGVLQDAFCSYPSSLFVAFCFSLAGFLIMVPPAVVVTYKDC